MPQKLAANLQAAIIYYETFELWLLVLEKKIRIAFTGKDGTDCLSAMARESSTEWLVAQSMLSTCVALREDLASLVPYKVRPKLIKGLSTRQ